MHMKKLTFILLILSGLGSFTFKSYSSLPFVISQVVLPFVENFDGVGDETPDTWLPEGWATLNASDDEYEWYWSPGPSEMPNGQMRSQSAYFNEDIEDWAPLSPDNWLFTPQISLDELTNDQTIGLTFRIGTTASGEEFKLENYSVLISTTDLEIESFTSLWTETLDAEFVTDSLYERNVDLTQFAGQNIYLAFRHHDVTDMDRLILDEVSVRVLGDTIPGTDSLIYSITIPLPEGEVEYKYFVVADAPSWDLGEWIGDPNRSFVVMGDTTLLDTWGEQSPVAKSGVLKQDGTYMVTFTVNMGNAMIGEGEDAVAFDPDVHRVFIAGSFGDDIEWNEPGSNAALELTLEGSVVSVPVLSLNADLRLFPNPARDQFTITHSSRINQVVISDITGRAFQTLYPDGHEVRVDTAIMNNGIYIVSVYTENGLAINKLQVQK
jgi:hypothetical protein